ncbi:MAG: type I-E CRISPR-associated protein Cas5/CasD [Candidatus Sericytochromatia bacterium]
MAEFLILRLQGVMQAWGKHTYEDYRPSELFPTRSALSGLLGACLGLDRQDSESLQALDASYRYAVRVDQRELNGGRLEVQRIFDYHTINESIRATGQVRTDPIQSYREYLYDAQFTVALSLTDTSRYTLEQLTQAVQTPVYTPFLGRHSCPLSRPLFERHCEAADAMQALAQVEPGKGPIYSEDHPTNSRFTVRDLPRYGRSRLFDTREVYLHQPEENDVLQSI